MGKICADAYGKFEPWMILEVVRVYLISLTLVLYLLIFLLTFDGRFQS